MMTEQKYDDGKRIALRLPGWLYAEVKASADQSGWDVSKQVRLELASLRGKGKTPTIPQGLQQSFSSPAQETPRRVSRRRRHAA